MRPCSPDIKPRDQSVFDSKDVPDHHDDLADKNPARESPSGNVVAHMWGARSWIRPGVLCSGKAEAAQENPALASQNFSKEAYVIKRLVTPMKLENDGTGTRSRYKKLTGRNPAMTETRRLTNGTVDTDALRKNCGMPVK